MTPEHKAAIAEGKRKAKEARMALYGDSKPIDQPPVKEPESRSVQVTYCPFDGDPHSTVWHGVTFKANVPVMLHRDMKDHYIEQLLPRNFAGTNGEVLTKHVPAMMFMGDLARGNPSFEVDGERAKRLVNKRILPQAGHGWAEDHADEIVEYR